MKEIKMFTFSSDGDNVQSINDKSKNLMNEFTTGRLKYNGRYIKAEINYINEEDNTFTIYNAKLDDKYFAVFSKDFEIYINGVIQSSDIYTIVQAGPNVVITFNENELNYSEFCADDVFVFGKFAEVDINEITTYLTTENNYYLLTEDEKLLII